MATSSAMILLAVVPAAVACQAHQRVHEYTPVHPGLQSLVKLCSRSISGLVLERQETGSHRFSHCGRMGLGRFSSDTDLRSQCRRNLFRIEHRNFSGLSSVSKSIVGASLNIPMLSFTAARESADSLLILKLDFGLGRMDVHVDILRSTSK